MEHCTQITNSGENLPYFIILNPVAGRGRALKLMPRIEAFFRSQELAHKLHLTTERGDATKAAREATSAGCRTVVAVGGDGTVNEVVNGLVGSRAALGIIPCGVGNDFARTLSLPKKWKAACQCIAQGKSRVVDVGIVNGRYFVNATGAGFDAAVANEVACSRKLIGGIWPYLFAVFRMLVRFKRGKIEFVFDDSIISTRAWLVAVTNGSTYGGGMKICPQAKIDDGFLDFCVIGDVSLWRVLYYLPLVIIGKHLGLPKIYSGKASKISLITPDYHFHMEGEVLTNSRLEISLQPQALRVVVCGNQATS